MLCCAGRSPWTPRHRRGRCNIAMLTKLGHNVGFTALLSQRAFRHSPLLVYPAVRHLRQAGIAKHTSCVPGFLCHWLRASSSSRQQAAASSRTCTDAAGMPWPCVRHSPRKWRTLPSQQLWPLHRDHVGSCFSEQASQSGKSIHRPPVCSWKTHNALLRHAGCDTAMEIGNVCRW